MTEWIVSHSIKEEITNIIIASCNDFPIEWFFTEEELLRLQKALLEYGLNV